MRRKKGHKKKLHPKVWERLMMVQNGISIIQRQPKGDTKKKSEVDLGWIDYDEEFGELKKKFKLNIEL